MTGFYCFGITKRIGEHLRKIINKKYVLKEGRKNTSNRKFGKNTLFITG
jgi:hypothetical protein